MGVLAWDDVRYVVKTKDADGHNASNKEILRGTSASASSGRILAILGPSGCGKTSLLNALSSRLDVKRGDSLSGNVTYDNEALRANGGRASLSYVEQEPKFFSNLTVRETLELDARLRGESDRDAVVLVNATLRKMSLMTCADTVVGGDTGGKAVAGISGGERRRLAIASETLGLGTEAHAGGLIVLVDEPTSGLDAFQADKMVEKLVELAEKENACVVCTLHQPRSASFAKVHDLLLLASGGRVAYHGPSVDAVDYFKSIGHPCPDHYNPAEFLIDLVSIDVGDGDGNEIVEAKSHKRVEDIVSEWEKRQRKSDRANGTDKKLSTTSKVARKQNCGPLKQFRLLAGRAWRQARREMWVNGVRMVASIGLAAAFGSCNYQLGLGPRSVKRRIAVLMQACINTSMLALVKSLNGFPRERATVRREMARQSGGYNPGPYFLSKLLIETPIDMVFPVVFGAVMAPMVGLNKAGRKMFLTTLALQSAAASSLGLSISALSPNAEVALAIGPCVMVLNIMLGDASGAFAEVPDSLAPLSKLSLIRHAFEGVLCSEFEGLVFENEDTDEKSKRLAQTTKGVKKFVRKFQDGVAPQTGEDVLEGLNLPLRGHAAKACKSQIGVTAMNIAVTYAALICKR